MIQPFGVAWAVGAAAVVAAVRLHLRRLRPSSRLTLDIHRYQVSLVFAALIGATAPTLLDRSRTQVWPVFGIHHATGALAVALVAVVIGRALARKDRNATAVLELLDLLALYLPIAYTLVAIASLDWPSLWALAQALVEGPLLLFGSAALWRKTPVRRLPGCVAGAHALIMAGSRALTANTAVEIAAIVGLTLSAGAVLSVTLTKHTRRARIIALHANDAQTSGRQPATRLSPSAPDTQTSRPGKNTPS